MDQFNETWDAVVVSLTMYGLDVIGALLILIAGWVASKWLGRRAFKMASRTERIDDTVAPLFAKITRIVVIVITLLTVLGQFGVETASIIAVLGTIGLAIGLALQGTLSNIASGIMLLVLRPFNVGDVVDIGGTAGIVDEIGLFTTDMHTFTNVAITMPNSQIWGTKIENYTANPTRRVDLKIGISYSDDIDKAIAVIDGVLSADDRVLADPEPLIAVGELGDNAVILEVRPWTSTDDVWPLRFALIKRIKERFDEEEISFPFPQRNIHLANPEALRG